MAVITRSRSWRKTIKACASAAAAVTTLPRNKTNSMAGYSGAPLPKKLGLKPNFRVAFFQLPGDVKTELKDALSECRLVKDGSPEQLDFAMLFAKSQAEMKAQFPKFARRLAP